MKKVHLAGLGLLAGFIMITAALAEGGRRELGSGGGFTGPGPEPITVQEALKRPDDSAVVLEGRLVKALGGLHYEFSDGTGSIIVEIEDHLWLGRQASPNDRVRLEGEVDRDFRQPPRIEVKRLTVL